MQAYIRTVSALSVAGGIIAMLLLAAGVLVTCQMIFIRYVLGSSTIWQTEFVIYAIMAATFIGSPAVLLERGHVGVDILPKAIGGRVGLAIELIGGLAGLAFCVLLAWSGWIYFHEAWQGNWRTATVWALPLWIPLLPLPAGIGLLALQYVAEIMKLRQGEHLAQGESVGLEEIE